jgi:hypothetical protein
MLGWFRRATARAPAQHTRVVVGRTRRRGRQALQRDAPQQARIVAEEDFSHAAGAELVDNLVRPDGRTQHEMPYKLWWKSGE